MTFISCDRFTLPNGLRVVVAPDHTTPVVAVSVHYDVGFRSEPNGRSGFAHLFEHLMFQGSESVSKLEHPRMVQGAGGTLNGTTSADYTAYHDVVPAEALEMVLFLEADRMRAPLLNDDHLRNQVAVVKEEIRRSVLGQPYGQFPSVLLRPLLFRTFANAHDGWGDFASLEQATLEDAAEFFDTYYAPANAVLTLAGDVTTSQAKTLVEQYFGDVPARVVPPRASFDEPAPTSTRLGEHHDRLAPLSAVAVGYRMPDPIAQVNDYLAHLVLIDVLVEGDGARLQNRLAHCVPPLVAGLSGGPLNNPFHARHPDAFSINAIAMPEVEIEQIVAAFDEELERLVEQPPSPREVAKSTSRWKASVYQQLDELAERALGLGLFELLHGKPELLPQMPERLDAVTSEAVAAAAKGLLADNRAVLTVIPGGLA